MTSAEQTRSRRGRPGHDQASVLRAAIDLFNRHGYEGTSMGDIARELGLVKSAIYHHVPSKEALLAAALDEALDALAAAIGTATATQTQSDATERLHSAIHRSVEILVEHLPAVTLLLRVRGNSEVEKDALRRRRDLDERLAGLVSQAIAQGSVRSDINADLASRLIFGMVNSLTEWYHPDGRVDPDTLADTVTALAFDGLRARP